MEYTNIQVERIRWETGAKKIKCSYGGSGKIMFQTPRMNVRMTSMPRFPGAVSLGIDTIPQSFRQFLETVETSACLALPDTLSHGSGTATFEKLAMFNDALVFDTDAVVVSNVEEHCTGRWNVSLLVQMDGAWVGQSSCWGLRFKIIQMKLHARVEAAPNKKREYAFFVSGSPYLFLPDPDQMNEDVMEKRIPENTDAVAIDGMERPPVAGLMSDGNI